MERYFNWRNHGCVFTSRLVSFLVSIVMLLRRNEFPITTQNTFNAEANEEYGENRLKLETKIIFLQFFVGGCCLFELKRLSYDVFLT